MHIPQELKPLYKNTLEVFGVVKTFQRYKPTNTITPGDLCNKLIPSAACLLQTDLPTPHPSLTHNTCDVSLSFMTLLSLQYFLHPFCGSKGRGKFRKKKNQSDPKLKRI